MNSNKKLLNDLQSATKDTSTKSACWRDFTLTFLAIGVEARIVPNMTAKVFEYISSASSIKEAEVNIKNLFSTTMSGGQNVFQLIQTGLEQRFEIIIRQLHSHINEVGKTIDYGCGSGTLSQMLSDRYGIDIEGVDVRDFRAETVSIPVHLFDGYRVPVADKHYDSAILTNVIHHEAENEKILEELDRIVREKLVIIETVPEAVDEASAKKDWGRMIMNDALWNRFFNYANIPVPGTYEIPANWIKRFEKYGWGCTHSEDLGFDQPTIQDRHHLFVFQR